MKEAGYTMNQTIDMYKNDSNITDKVCYCGRLDPMARGLIYLLIGNECKMMDHYNKFLKEYKFEIIFGISTDSDDPLGAIQLVEIIDMEQVKHYVATIQAYIQYIATIGTFEQDFHDFSTKKINGKSLWYYKKNNIVPYEGYIKPSHSVTLSSVSYDDIKQYNFNEWRHNIICIIERTRKNGDNSFRQDEIISMYNNLKLDTIISLPITVTVSSGFYIRQLVADIMKHIKIPILTFDINRTAMTWRCHIW